MTRATRKRQAQQAAKRRDNTTLLIAGGIVAIVVVALLVFLNVSQPHTSAPVNTQGRTWGDPNAKVTIDEWSDFQ